MNLRYTTLFFLFLCLQSNAQQGSDINGLFTAQNKDKSWIEVDATKSITAATYFAQTYKLYGLQSASDMVLEKNTPDSYGWTHHKFRQYHQQIRVEGGTYLLHEKEGRIVKANGEIVPNIRVNTSPAISLEKSIEFALNYHPAQQYKWEIPNAEATLQRIKKDPKATYYPQPELVIVDRAYPLQSGQMALAYKMEIYATKPLGKYTVYIDAHSGALLQSYNSLHPTNDVDDAIDATAETRFHGTQTIRTTQLGNGKYVLRDDSRGVSIETYNAKGNPSTNVDFVDDDNYWNNVNAAQDEVATDAHFGAESTYDFYKTYFDRDSYDDKGSPLISYVHFGEDFVNAFWDGNAMTYGDGDGVIAYPLTAIDVCGHEISHGVTQFSAGLVYAYESGALNESFSDVLGKAIEKLYEPNGFNWLIGERMAVEPQFYFRSMADPNLRGDPKSYKGKFWYEGTGDSGGVHTNSGVQNFWFYTLVEGAEGVTEAGMPYKVPKIGINAAMRIAYRNLTVYLTESSNYEDAREGSLQAAADLYGYCSENYLAVASAWYAAGLGFEIVDGDYYVKFDETAATVCEITEVEVKIDIFNNGCNETLPIGTKIPTAYQLDNMPLVRDTVVLIAPLGPGEQLPYAFTQTTPLMGYGEHKVKAWVQVPGDVLGFNDFIEYTLLNRPYQNEDFGIASISSPGGVCSNNPSKPIFAEAQYLGCDSLAPTNLPYSLYFKGLLLEEVELTFFRLAPFDITPVFGQFYFTEYGFDTGIFRLNFPGDPNSTNDVGTFFIGRLDKSSVGWSEDFAFQGKVALDSTYFSVRPEENTRNKIQLVDDNALVTTGGDIFDELGNLLVRPSNSPEAFMINNASFITTMDICVDVQGMDNPYLFFELTQTHSDENYEQLGINPDFSTMLGVYLDGQLLDTILYGRNNTGSDFIRYEYDLKAFRNASHNIQLRALSLTASVNPNTGDILFDGDNNILDRVWIANKVNTGIEEITNADLLQISPNPSFGNFYLSRKDGRAFEQGNIQIFDAAGKLQAVKSFATDSSISFGQDLAPGIYFVRVIDGDHTGFLKIVKQ